MFEFLMLIGFLAAGLCHWRPREVENESAGSEEERGMGRDRKANVREERQAHRAARVHTASA
ncbi:hypothetical protein [Desulfuromonas sp. TF]|uniref:hypothetical protein n=1 Tax=Desulfuromonas sp. TF TaxID=1232410 RepID=UPI0012DFDCAC|nr:hypothetical protein [Desulfuromonas sp. TF]